MRRRKIDGCPIAGALQLIGDKWTMLVVRDLFAGPKRTTELLEDLHPISSRTLMGRLREMEQDALILRNNYGGLPRRVEYELTERGRRLVPLLDGWQLPDADVVALISSRHGRSLRATRFLDHLYSSLSQLLWMPSVAGERAERGRPASPGP